MRLIAPNLATVSLFLILAGQANGSALPDAAKARDHGQLSQLLANGADVESAHPDGMTALHWAVYYEERKSATALIEAGSDPDGATRYGVTPLSIACRNGDAALTSLLLAAGANPNNSLPSGETILMTAARTGVVECVEALLKAGAEIEAALPNGQTALFWAANEGHLAVTQLLIDSGADYTTPLKSGFTPFFLAVRQGDRAMIDYFIGLGVDINATMQIEETFKRSVQKGTSPLILALENGHFEIALKFIELGADPNDDRTGQTPLHHLVRVRKTDKGESERGTPPPPIRGDMDSLDFARAIIERGADVNARVSEDVKLRFARLDAKLATPFFLACDTADLAYMKFLIEHGADPTLGNTQKTTPLMAAAGAGSFAPEEEAGTPDECLEAVKFLVELGADVNAINDNGDTAMHAAAYKNAPQVVQYLHEQGALAEIWNVNNKRGWTPLLIAEGYRPGNFKPSFETVDAIVEVMEAQGAPMPTGPKPVHVNY